MTSTQQEHIPKQKKRSQHIQNCCNYNNVIQSDYILVGNKTEGGKEESKLQIIQLDCTCCSIERIITHHTINRDKLATPIERWLGLLQINTENPPSLLLCHNSIEKNNHIENKKQENIKSRKQQSNQTRDISDKKDKWWACHTRREHDRHEVSGQRKTQRNKDMRVLGVGRTGIIPPLRTKGDYPYRENVIIPATAQSIMKGAVT